ncbi:hypothetical protein BRC91_06395 [Halobacteriales archaeon QS_4_62_28]|nr:MAG: hypothetical protein BRC91_06395 [Halobacteriales archaeon QS_4_62_28]
MPSRRTYLRTCLGAGLAGVAGCLTDSGTTTPATETDASTGTTTDAPTATATPVPAAGEIAWRESLGGTVEHRPAIGTDRLFAGTESGTVVALSRDGGVSQWTTGTDAPIQDAPVVADESVLAVSGQTALHEHHTVVAFAAGDGTEQWRFEPDDWWLGIVGVSDGTAFVASTDDHLQSDGQTLYALSLADGTKEWSVEIGDNRGGFVAGDTIYIPVFRRLYAVGTDGTTKWTYDIPEYQFNTLAVVGETVALVSAEDFEQPVVHGIDATTGEQRFTFAPEWRAYTTHAVDDSLIVGGGEKIARLDPETGETEWIADLPMALYDAPVVDGTMYVSSRTAAAVSVESGDVVWTTDLDVEFARPVGVTGETLLLHKSAGDEDRNRHVVALDRATGDRRWEFAGDAELTTPALGTDRLYFGEESEIGALKLS